MCHLPDRSLRHCHLKRQHSATGGALSSTKIYALLVAIERNARIP